MENMSITDNDENIQNIPKVITSNISSTNEIDNNNIIIDEYTQLLTDRDEGYLQLKDGSTWKGYSFGYPLSISGEVVFNTAMVGYPETLTDPSYKGQILVLTYPSIGNYGIPSDIMDENKLLKYFESSKIQISGLIISNYSQFESHWNSNTNLSNWLIEHKIPAIYGIDTRQLTIKLRDNGLLLGKLIINDNYIDEWYDPNTTNLVSLVSIKQPYILNDNPNYKTIIVVDCGIKYNIIRNLLNYNVRLKIVPWDYNFNLDIEREDIAGLFISNGPGNPSYCDKTIEHIRLFISNNTNHIPIFAICLGHQLLALAIGAHITKLKYGNRSLNQPCIDLRTARCHITPQNHSYVVNENTLPMGWKQLFYNANDNSNEGIIHEKYPYLSVQFHPEGKCGPSDTNYLFQSFISSVEKKRMVNEMPKWITPKTYHNILLLGSGGSTIGPVSEFDYSGSQVIKALKEMNVRVILINPNIATVQTSNDMVDKLYFYPVTKDYIEEVIKIEQPDGIIITFGGQTALKSSIELYKSGILDKYNVKVIGTPIETIIKIDDREILSQEMIKINEPISYCKSITTIEEAIDTANDIGYPVMYRNGFYDGCMGSGFADNQVELVEKLTTMDLSKSVLIEKSILGWKKIEYEVVRDQYDNCITICNMEHLEPTDVHIGDSIVVVPSQTLSNDEYYMLRTSSIKITRHLGIIGECNVQFALNPNSNQYYIIEVNARLSRSSALASKATGYPLAYIAAKLGLGENLSVIRNGITKKTTACYEPTLDYLVVKIPKWDLSKFSKVNNKIGSATMSVGEVMAIGRNFEETLQKAIRMVDDSKQGFQSINIPPEEIDDILIRPSPLRLYVISNALDMGYSIQKINKLTHIDLWFLAKLDNIHKITKALINYIYPQLPTILLKEAKQIGFSDKSIGTHILTNEINIRELRIKHNIKPVVKQIDTSSGEYPAEINYLYTTYNGLYHDIDYQKTTLDNDNNNSIIVLGGGVYRTNSSVEIDWCAVSAIRTLKKEEKTTIVINYNPETVSTDYDETDRLYFEEISLERVLDIYQLEKPFGVIISVGGQTPNNISLELSNNNVKILGTQPDNIDKTEDRNKFSNLLDSIYVDQPEWEQLTNLDSAIQFCKSIDYPCLIRPSYVLSGALMKVVYNHDELEKYLTTPTTQISNEHPVVISKFMKDHKEIEIDAVANKGELICYGISEHVENAGVHSGDATLILPAQKLYLETVKRIKKITRMIAKSLDVSGPFNIKFLSKDNNIKVIECNLRASRSFPFVSTCFGVNFIELSTLIMLDIPFPKPNLNIGDIDYVCIKKPMFSFSRLPNTDTILGVEMNSTGEVVTFSDNIKDAYINSMVASGLKIPKQKILIIIEANTILYELQKDIEKLIKNKFTIYTNQTTYQLLENINIPSNVIQDTDLYSQLRNNKIELIINIPYSEEDRLQHFKLRRTAIEHNIPIMTNIKTIKLLISSINNYNGITNQVHSWDYFISQKK